MGEELRNTINSIPDNEQPSEESSIYDEAIIPDKFITPSAAEGPDVHNLKARDFEMPVSFELEDGRFKITGIESRSQSGAIISGRISGGEVKINHINLDEGLRGTGMSKVLLSDLEGCLSNQGGKTVYAAFFKAGTVEFLLKNGYTIIPASSLTEDTKRHLLINIENLDPNITTREGFESAKNQEDRRQILLVKKIGY